MLSGTLTLKDVAGTDHSFATINYDNGGATRVDTAASLAEPSVLKIQHTSSGSGNSKVDRHLIQRQDVVIDNASTYRVTTNVTITNPESFDASDIVVDQLRQIIDLLTSGTTPTVDDSLVSQLLRGES